MHDYFEKIDCIVGFRVTDDMLSQSMTGFLLGARVLDIADKMSLRSMTGFLLGVRVLDIADDMSTQQRLLLTIQQQSMGGDLLGKHGRSLVLRLHSLCGPVLLFVFVAHATLMHIETNCWNSGKVHATASVRGLHETREKAHHPQEPCPNDDKGDDSSSSTTLHILLFENSNASTSTHASRILLPQVEGMATRRVTASVFGLGYEFQGFGTKQQAVLPILQAMIQQEDQELEKAQKGDGDTSIAHQRNRQIVVIADARDILLNIPNTTLRDFNLAEEAVDEFIRQFDALTTTTSFPTASDDSFYGPVVVSAEAQCCVSSMGHNPPDAFYFANGTRHVRACLVIEKGCEWLGFAASVKWNAMMEARAAAAMADMYRRNATSHALSLTKDGPYQDVYLNAGLMAGTPRSLFRLLQRANIAPNEDDQGALSGYWYWNPNDIVLDYGQALFGNSRFSRKANHNEGCVFDVFTAVVNGSAIATRQIVHTETSNTPLFLHNPGKYWECQEAIGRRLGLSEPFY